MAGGVAIFGSCVTRDLFEDPRLRPALSVYGARSSVVSAVAPRVCIDESRIQLPSAWQRRCVLADLHKTFFSSLAEAHPDWLVIDLIDERFDLLRCSGSIITRSSAFQACGLGDEDGLELVPVRRMSDQGEQLFADAARRFAGRVLEVLPGERVILHRAHWCSRYRDGDQVASFPEQRRQLCVAQNAMLQRGYDALDRAFAGRALTLTHDAALADAGHRWQLEPFHYDAPTNGALIEQLAKTVGEA